jgi:hypothetical protein
LEIRGLGQVESRQVLEILEVMGHKKKFWVFRYPSSLFFNEMGQSLLIVALYG